MKFWDASALVPLLIDEVTSAAAREAYATDPTTWVWWATELECTSAIARLEREGGFEPHAIRLALDRLNAFKEEWTVIEPSTRLREWAVRLVRLHQLRAADALQLAAAGAAAEGRPSELPFVTTDDRLAIAADREGFPVIRFDRPTP